MLLSTKLQFNSRWSSRLLSLTSANSSQILFSTTSVKSAVIQVKLDEKLEEKLLTAELKVSNKQMQ